MAFATLTSVPAAFVSVTESDTGLRLFAAAPFWFAFVDRDRPTEARSTLKRSASSFEPSSAPVFVSVAFVPAEASVMATSPPWMSNQ